MAYLTNVENRLASIASHINMNDSSVQTAVLVGAWSVGTLLT